MHTHITFDERARIAHWLARGRRQNTIAEEIGVSPGTLSREVKRNQDPDGRYRARSAHRRARSRRGGKQEAKKVIENDLELYQYVVHSLEYYWSPEQIAGRLERSDTLPSVSHPTIYAFVKRDRPDLKPCLRHRRHRRRSKISPKEAMKRSIEQRPKHVLKRGRLGDWEGDTIVGKERKERILTHVERKSGLLVAKRTTADSHAVRLATRQAFRRLPVSTITYDNGSEFAAFPKIEDDIRAHVYFAHPGVPSERGTNENCNGLLRQFFPKGSSFATITQKDVDRAVVLLNNRPRKRLDYRTPLEVFLLEKEVAFEGLM